MLLVLRVMNRLRKDTSALFITVACGLGDQQSVVILAAAHESHLHVLNPKP